MREQPEVNQKECDYMEVSGVKGDPGQIRTLYLTPSYNLIFWLKARNFIKDFTGKDYLSADKTGVIDFNKKISTHRTQKNITSEVDEIPLSDYIRNVLNTGDRQKTKFKIKWKK